jgi:hypothetical protein
MTLPRFFLATISGHRNQKVAWWGASLQVKILETTVYREVSSGPDLGEKSFLL